MISSADLAHYRVSRAKDWVSVDCGTNYIYSVNMYIFLYFKSIEKWEYIYNEQL